MNRLSLARCRHFAGAACLLLLITAAPAVLAHTEPTQAQPGPWRALARGFGHPFTGADHLAAMLALGVWSALTMRRRWLAPLAFASALLLGALLAMAGVVPSAVEPMIAASLLMLGLLIVVRLRLALAAGLTLAAGFALFHGAAHGQELAGAYGLIALCAMVVATGLLHAGGIVIGLELQRRDAWLTRAVGLAVAALGAALMLPQT